MICGGLWPRNWSPWLKFPHEEKKLNRLKTSIRHSVRAGRLFPASNKESLQCIVPVKKAMLWPALKWVTFNTLLWFFTSPLFVVCLAYNSVCLRGSFWSVVLIFFSLPVLKRILSFSCKILISSLLLYHWPIIDCFGSCGKVLSKVASLIT